MRNTKLNSVPESAYYEKSRQGLWVKAERSQAEIRFFFHERVVVDQGRFKRLSASGDSIQDGPLAGMGYTTPWMPCGTVAIDSAMAVLCPHLQDLEWLAFGVQRHATRLIAQGFGEEASDVAGWFTPENLVRGEFLVADDDDTIYEVVPPDIGVFEGLLGSEFVIGSVADGVVTGIIMGRGKDIPFDLDLKDHLLPILVSTAPVQG